MALAATRTALSCQRPRVRVSIRHDVRSMRPRVYSAPAYSSNAQDCAVGFVVLDNKSHPQYTKLQIEVEEVPGLGVRVQQAVIQTIDGVAHDTFWITTIDGKKLSDGEAALLSERVTDFCVACQPKCASPTWTVMNIAGEPSRPGFLLEIASVLSGVGAEIKEGFIQGAPAGPGSPVDIAPPDHDFARNGRYFKFHLADRAGGKLDAARVSAVLFTYDVFTGQPIMPTVVPHMDNYLTPKVVGCE